MLTLLTETECNEGVGMMRAQVFLQESEQLSCSSVNGSIKHNFIQISYAI